jgi:general stress protein 26
MNRQAKLAAKKAHKQLYDIIKDFRTAMLISHKLDGSFRARPMAVAKMKTDGEAYFLASVDASLLKEIEANPNVLLTFQSTGEFACIEGVAHVLQDKTLIAQLWSEALKAWIPKGKADPALCILKISGTQGEYWDASILQGFKHLFVGMSRLAKQQRHAADSAEHGKVKL